MLVHCWPVFSEPEDCKKMDAKVYHENNNTTLSDGILSQLLMEKMKRQRKWRERLKPLSCFCLGRRVLCPSPWIPLPSEDHMLCLGTTPDSSTLSDFTQPWESTFCPNYCHLYNGRGHFYCTLNLSLTNKGYEILVLCIVILYLRLIIWESITQLATVNFHKNGCLCSDTLW